MTRDILLDAIGNAADEVLLRGERYSRIRRITAAASAAAVILCAVCGTAFFQEQQRLAALPHIEIAPSAAAGMGFEAYHAYYIAEIENGNPWSAENAPDSLPVFRNAGANPYEVHTGLSEEEMRTRLAETAAALGEELTDIQIHTAGETYRTDTGHLVPPDTILRITASAGDYALEILPDAALTVRYPSGTALPDDLHFTYTDSTAEQADAALAWLCERFSALTKFAEPIRAVQTSRHTTDGALSRTYRTYDGAGSSEDAILAYNFSYAQFAPSDTGELMLIRLFELTSGVTEIGDYPLITAAEAEELLLTGTWYTTSPAGQPTAAQIARVELVYLHGTAAEYWMPYYRFYVELPEAESEDALKQFAAYYVPAVEGKYLIGT